MKHTRAFQLKAYDKPVEVVEINDRFYPVSPEDKEIFIRGIGRKRIGNRKRYPLERLPEKWTAEDLRKVYDQYGDMSVVLGLLSGWGNQSLFEDNSYGLRYHKAEVTIMAHWGSLYDEMTDKTHEIDLAWEKSLKDNHKISIVKSRNDYVLYIDEDYLFSTYRAYPSQYIEMLLMGMVPCKPIFNPMDFEDEILAKLIVNLGGWDKYRLAHPDDESVKTKLTYLTNSEVSNMVENIFNICKEVS
jgi:hypothetical protein